MSRPVPLYRLQGHGDHFYTTSAAERDNAIAQYGYTSEGIACYVFADDGELAERDSIAVQVLAGFATAAPEAGAEAGARVVRGDVERAYAYADAMIAHRDGNGGP